MGNSSTIHSCGWSINPEDKFCRGCGERVFKVSRDYSEIVAEMETIKRSVMEKPNPAYASVAMLVFNILSWSCGEGKLRPSEMMKEVEKLADKFPGYGFPPGFSPPSA